MTDILTKDERETVERAKTLLADKWSYGIGEWVGVSEILLDIIDNLSKRGVKKYDEDELLEIVDSQAQKIAEQAQTIATNADYAIELQGKIAEQAKEIERMKDTYNHCQEYLEKMRGKNEKANVEPDTEELKNQVRVLRGFLTSEGFTDDDIRHYLGGSNRL